MPFLAEILGIYKGYMRYYMSEYYATSRQQEKTYG